MPGNGAAGYLRRRGAVVVYEQQLAIARLCKQRTMLVKDFAGGTFFATPVK
jgi:hypothetical protein